jgi:hypothetical protein
MALRPAWETSPSTVQYSAMNFVLSSFRFVFRNCSVRVYTRVCHGRDYAILNVTLASVDQTK